MDKKEPIYELDRILILCVLSRVSMTRDRLREELIRMTDGAFSYPQAYLSGLLAGLCGDGLLQRSLMSGEGAEYACVQGSEKLRSYLSAVAVYDRILLSPESGDGIPKLRFADRGEYERQFGA